MIAMFNAFRSAIATATAAAAVCVDQTIRKSKFHSVYALACALVDKRLFTMLITLFSVRLILFTMSICDISRCVRSFELIALIHFLRCIRMMKFGHLNEFSEEHLWTLNVAST